MRRSSTFSYDAVEEGLLLGVARDRSKKPCNGYELHRAFTKFDASLSVHGPVQLTASKQIVEAETISTQAKSLSSYTTMGNMLFNQRVGSAIAGDDDAAKGESRVFAKHMYEVSAPRTIA